MASALIATGDLMMAAPPPLLGESKEETSSESLQKWINATFTNASTPLSQHVGKFAAKHHLDESSESGVCSKPSTHGNASPKAEESTKFSVGDFQ
jgi:hypothetical protein